MADAATQPVGERMPAFLEHLPRHDVCVATTQMACGWDTEENLQRAEALVRQAAAKGAQIILVQELFASVYFCQHEEMALFTLASPCDEANNPSMRLFASLAKELRVVLPCSFFEVCGQQYFNSLVVFDADGSSLGLYRKSHIPTGPGYQEKFFFTPGDTGFKVFDTAYAKVGVAICWDQWFPESARSMALQGAEILFYPSAIGNEPQDESLDSSDHWETVMRGHAGANLMPLVASNRIGVEGDLAFFGGSFICNDSGEVVAKASKDKEEVLVATFDLREMVVSRASWGLFRDRRPDLYGALVQSSIPPGNLMAAKSIETARPACGGVAKNPKPRAAPGPSSTATAQPALTTPAGDGFRMPAEYSPQRRTWMAWPYTAANWRQGAEPAREQVAGVVRAIAAHQPVWACATSDTYGCALEALGDTPNVTVLEMSYDDLWMRDIGPTFLKSPRTGEVRGVDWVFNAWGGLTALKHDLPVARKVLALAQCQRYASPFVMEGGSFHVDGEGTAITTSQCLLNPDRNPTKSQQEIEAHLKEFLGVAKVVWLPEGIHGDLDTSGHVDNLCFFARPGQVVMHWPEAGQPGHAAAAAAYKLLLASTDAKGRPFQVDKLIAPPQAYYTAAHLETLVADGQGEGRSIGDPLPRSYANCYLCNGAVIAPAFGEASDAKAHAQLQELFPERTVVSVPTSEIVLGGGNIHCITQQEPL